jgi:3-keto-disaccharide hydrolase
MTRFIVSISVLLVVSHPLAVAEPPAGFVSLWNGKDLAGWHYMDTFDHRKLAAMSEADRAAQLAKWAKQSEGHWSVDGDTIVNDGKGAFLTTDKDYGDIELLVEYKMAPRGDSGIYLRGCPQVQIWDPADPASIKHGADKGSGGLWNNSAGAPGKDPLVLADKPMGEWNKFRIIQVGERVTVWLNDKLVVDHARLENYFEKDRRKPLPRTGPIQLQTHGSEIHWRNLFVREIGAAEANAILRDKNAGGFRRVFNGQDFTGWAGAVDSYEVKDAAIVCRPKKGGTIYTDEQFGNFVARIEFQLPPGGNNGLAIRYPGDPSGKLDTAYNGMCEIQVLDDPHPMYAKLDPRQFNGSAYGMVAAERGYLRPTGEWNFEEVTVKGPTIVVELNGTRILDGDLSKVTDYMGGKPHPGKERTAGHFGFAGHNDPVAFRNILIKPID